MSIIQVLILVFSALLCGYIRNPRHRNIFLLLLSLLFYYHFQPASSILFLDYWLPTAAIVLGIILWLGTQPELCRAFRENVIPLLIILLTIFAVAANRYLAFCCLTPTRPPQLGSVVLFLAISLPSSALLLSRISFRPRLVLLTLLLLLLFVILKLPEASLGVSKFLRLLNRQDPRFSTANELVWLGISYILFRMLHILFDLRAGRLKPTSLTETLTYLFFFPALVAGPIARFPQFQGELAKPPQRTESILGLRRVFRGIFRKFVLADSLALLSLSPQNATQIQSPWYLWIALLAYSLRIYFDFSGYTDIAIGSSQLMGIHLPENFNAPYLKSSLIHFWNSWHITLADWFRSYIFNPLTRKLRASSSPQWLSILIPQLTTMLLIGLWHGFTPNFLIWGAWHGMGLFVNNRWNTWSKIHPPQIPAVVQSILGWALTFGFVSLGWVWFVMPSFSSSLVVLGKLFGWGG